MCFLLGGMGTRFRFLNPPPGVRSTATVPTQPQQAAATAASGTTRAGGWGWWWLLANNYKKKHKKKHIHREIER